MPASARHVAESKLFVAPRRPWNHLLSQPGKFRQCLRNLDPADPKTSRILILTAYAMWHRRTVARQMETNQAERGSEDEDWGDLEAEEATDEYTKIRMRRSRERRNTIVEKIDQKNT